ncbi:NAD(P)-binding protein [Thozetella sp. PMI_491]|nr:NAD(P)-binding protein [Thozetella sp. PMI_491]
MVVVAVAGGSGKLGRAIVDALITKSGHDVLVLARQGSEAKETPTGARLVHVDYDNVDKLASQLRTNNVEVVVSAISGIADIEPELKLIKAADKSPVTKRYIPNIWGVKYTPRLASFFPHAQAKITVLEALESTTSLEYTAVLNGFFLDYWVLPKVKSYFDPLPLVIDMPNNIAAIPGSGDVPITFTHTWDIACFVPALLTLPRWEKESYVIGDKVTWNQFVKFAEEARGFKFTVTYDSVEKLKAGEITELPSHQHLYPFFPKETLRGLFAAFGRMFEEGDFDLKPSRPLNDVFPEIKTRGVKQLLFEAWKQS